MAALCLAALIGSAAAFTHRGRTNARPIVVTGPPEATTAVDPAAPREPATATAIKPPSASGAPPQPVDSQPAPLVKTGATSTVPETLAVHVAGAVKNPGLYQLPPGSRVANAIHAAGGPGAAADLDSVNLAEKIQDGEKVYVPRKSEHKAPAAPPGNALGRVSIMPLNPIGSGGEAPHADPVPAPDDSPPPSTGHHSGTSAANKISSASGEIVNINSASAEELQRLPGIGPAMAERILEFRKTSGGFTSVDQLREVKGIGEKKFAKIAPLVTLR